MIQLINNDKDKVLTFKTKIHHLIEKKRMNVQFSKNIRNNLNLIQ